MSRDRLSISRLCVQVYKHRIQVTRLNAGRKRGQGWRTEEIWVSVTHEHNTLTVFTDSHNPPTVRSARPFLALRWHKSAASRDTLKRSLHGLNHGDRNSQVLDKFNLNLVRKNVRRCYRLLCSPTAQWCSWLAMFEWFLSQWKRVRWKRSWRSVCIAGMCCKTVAVCRYLS